MMPFVDGKWKQKHEKITDNYHNEVPHFRRLRNCRADGTAAGQQHQLLWIIVQQIVHDAGSESGLAL